MELLPVDVAYINAFVKAVKEVLASTVQIPVTRCTPHLKEWGEKTHKVCQLSVCIGLSGPVNGLVVASFTEHVACQLASTFAGSPLTPGSPDCYDAISELANIIVGNAKNNLPVEGVSVTVPTLCPTVQVQYPPGIPVIVIPFDSASGRIRLEVALRMKKAA
jgi:chemotaxis protein CheX